MQMECWVNLAMLEFLYSPAVQCVLVVSQMYETHTSICFFVN